MHTEPLPSPIGEGSSQETPAQAQEVSASTLMCVGRSVIVSAGFAECAADAHHCPRLFQTTTPSGKEEPVRATRITHSGLHEASEEAPKHRGVGEAHRGTRGQSMTRRRFSVAEAATLRPGRVVHPATLL